MTMNLGIFNDLWIRRQLVWHLAQVDLKIRYKNSYLGFAWAIIEPLLMLAVLYLVFTTLFKFEIENYALYLLIGIITWNMFSRGTSLNCVSILNKANVITKFYFPREVLIVSTTITALLMMMFEFIVLGFFFGGTQFIPPISGFLMIPLMGLLFIFTLAISLPLSVLNVHYRDVGVIWSIILQAGFFLSPIIYKLEHLPEFAQQILWFNPMTQIIDTAHNLLLYEIYPEPSSIAYMLATTFGMSIIGIAIFRKYNPGIVEVL